jgi:hypothetical protein
MTIPRRSCSRFHTTQQSTHVISSFTTLEFLVEHLDTSQGCLEVGTKTNNLNVSAFGDDTSLNTSSGDGTTTGDGEDIYDAGDQKTGPVKSIGFLDFYLRWASRTVSRGHLIIQKRVENHVVGRVCGRALTRRKFKPGVTSLDELSDLLLTNLGITALKGGESGAHDDGGVLTIEVVGGQEIPHFHIDELQHLRVRDHVDLVNEDNEPLDSDLAGEKQVFTGLGHLTVGSRDDNDTAIHLSSTGNHVLDVCESLVTAQK